MPKLDSPMHVTMLKTARTVGQIERDGIYGLQWGDPQTHPALRWVRDHYLLPYVNPDHSAVEIGPGGGRWTRYLLGFGQLCAVDYHQELLDELLRNYRAPHLSTLRNNGTDFPGIPDASVDFVFSFGVFVHLDIDLIEAYFRSIHRIMKRGGCALIQYSDKNKEVARKHSQAFSDTTPETIRPLVIGCGHRILEDDTTTMWHSSIVRFAPIPYPEQTSHSPEVKSNGALPVPRVMKEINYGSLLDIVSRIKRTRGFARPDDFTTVSNGSSAEQSMCPLMYCVDFKTQQVIYTMHDPEDIDVTIAEPFLFVAQLQHAQKILSLPIEHIGSDDIDRHPAANIHLQPGSRRFHSALCDVQGNWQADSIGTGCIHSGGHARAVGVGTINEFRRADCGRLCVKPV